MSENNVVNMAVLHNGTYYYVDVCCGKSGIVSFEDKYKDLEKTLPQEDYMYFTYQLTHSTKNGMLEARDPFEELYEFFVFKIGEFFY